MSDNMSKITYRLGAIFYILWGLIHIVAANGIYQVGLTQGPGTVQARLYQGAWNMLYLAIFTIVIGVIFNWKNSLLGYWLNLATVSVTDIGFIVLVLIPGYSTDILGPILWVLGVIFSTIGIMKAPREP